MAQHAAYTQEHIAAGRVIALGFVFAPSEAFGIAVLVLPDTEAAQQLANADPSVQAGLTRYQIFSMLLAAAQAVR